MSSKTARGRGRGRAQGRGKSKEKLVKIDTTDVAENLPLYDTLDSDKTLIDISTICRTILLLDNEHTRNIYAIILHHYILENGNIPNAPPYRGAVFVGGKGIKFTWSDLPDKLQLVIANYIDSNKVITKPVDNPQ
jgi:hypothetical protein